MKIFPCYNCGVVLDADSMNFWAYDDYGDPKPSSIWNGEEYVATSPCPVCGEVLLNPIDHPND